MTADRYTRIVLTLIAACLVYLCAREAAPPIQAQQAQPPLEVVLVGVRNNSWTVGARWDALAVRMNEPVRVDTNSPLNVNMKNTQDLTVKVSEPVKVDTTSPLKVKVDPYPPLEVKVTNSPLNVNVTNTNR